MGIPRRAPWWWRQHNRAGWVAIGLCFLCYGFVTTGVVRDNVLGTNESMNKNLIHNNKTFTKTTNNDNHIIPHNNISAYEDDDDDETDSSSSFSATARIIGASFEIPSRPATPPVVFDGQPVRVVATARNSRNFSHSKIRADLDHAPGEEPHHPGIDRIYYLNHDDQPIRRTIMEDWLSAQPIPYQRIPAVVVEKEDFENNHNIHDLLCGPQHDPDKCRERMGDALSHLSIPDSHNTTGFTLVLEDTFAVTDMDKLLLSIGSVPNDWDVLRWDCWEQPPPCLPRYSNGLAYSTTTTTTEACGDRHEEYCGGAHASLWRGGASVAKLQRVWSRLPYGRVDCRLSDPSLKSYCINVGVGEWRRSSDEVGFVPKNATALATVLPVLADEDIESVLSQKKTKSRRIIRDAIAALPNPGPEISIDRIYYINMDHRWGRRSIMEQWLSKQNLPYERVRGLPGTPYDCVPRKNGGAGCVGVSGVAFSNLQIMETYNTTGYTLVLEDDFVLDDMEKAVMAVPLVPADWDVIRFDCWDQPLGAFPTYGGRGRKALAFSVTIDGEKTCPTDGRCYFCGGNHAVLWKDSSIGKLREVWSRVPYDGVDCRLSDPSLKSYCINIGVGKYRRPKNESSDIPK